MTLTDTFTVPGVGSWKPLLIISDQLERPARVVVHELISSPQPAVTLLPTLPRRGTLRLLTQGAVDATAACLVLSSGQPITLVADPPQLSMRFVVTDPGVGWETDTETEDRLVYLTVPFQEVAS